MCVCSMSHIWRSESNWWKLSFSCHHVGPRSQTQVISLGNSNPYPLSLCAFKIFFSFPIPLLEQTQQTECNTPFQHLSSIPHISFDITPFPHPSAIRTNTWLCTLTLLCLLPSKPLLLLFPALCCGKLTPLESDCTLPSWRIHLEWSKVLSTSFPGKGWVSSCSERPHPYLLPALVMEPIKYSSICQGFHGAWMDRLCWVPWETKEWPGHSGLDVLSWNTGQDDINFTAKR